MSWEVYWQDIRRFGLCKDVRQAIVPYVVLAHEVLAACHDWPLSADPRSTFENHGPGLLHTRSRRKSDRHNCVNASIPRHDDERSICVMSVQSIDVVYVNVVCLQT